MRFLYFLPFFCFIASAFITADSKNLLGRHDERAYTVAFNPEGTLLASGSNDNSIKIWDVQAKSLKHSFIAHSVGVKDLVFTIDGQQLVSAGLDGEIRVWNTANWKREKALTDHTSQVLALATSPDGKYLYSGSDDKKIIVWELPDFKKVTSFTAHSDRVLSLNVSGNGKYLVSTGGDRTVKGTGNLKVWKTSDWSLAFEMEEETYAIQDAALSSGGTLVLYAGNFSEAVYYKWPDNKVAAKKRITDYGINSVVLNGATAYLGTSYNGKLVEWSMKTGELKELQGHKKDINNLALSQDKAKIASCGTNGNVVLWKTN